MDTNLECWTKGSRRGAAVEEALRQQKCACEDRLRQREDQIRKLAMIQNGKHPDYQKTKHETKPAI